MSDYEFAPIFQRATLDDYVRLFDVSYGGDSKLSTEYIDWEYRRNPHGPVIGFDAFDGNQLAAHYAIIPRRYSLADRVFNAALSVNTATHPDHQGKRLFVRLADATYTAATAAGVQFVVGIANASSVGGFIRRLGFSSLGQVRLYVGFRGPQISTEALDLQVDADWLGWRLANPSRRYVVLRHGDGSSTIRTFVKHTPFNIGRVSNSLLSHGRIDSLTAGAPLPGLTPLFVSSRHPSLPLPLWVQPSPWHVIWRSLASNIEPSLPSQLRFEGFGMDTF